MLEALAKRYSCDFYLVMDKKYFPYGNKKLEILEERLCYLIEYLIDKKCDKIIIACNTLCTTVLNRVRNKYDIEIINIVDPVIEYVKNLKINEVTLLATSNTIKSNYYQERLKEYKIKCNVINGDKYIYDIENNNSFSFNEKTSEYLILGCTDFINYKDKFSAKTITQDELIKLNKRIIIEET